jgi:hypothetical protein
VVVGAGAMLPLFVIFAIKKLMRRNPDDRFNNVQRARVPVET